MTVAIRVGAWAAAHVGTVHQFVTVIVLPVVTGRRVFLSPGNALIGVITVIIRPQARARRVMTVAIRVGARAVGRVGAIDKPVPVVVHPVAAILHAGVVDAVRITVSLASPAGGRGRAAKTDATDRGQIPT